MQNMIHKVIQVFHSTLTQIFYLNLLFLYVYISMYSKC